MEHFGWLEQYFMVLFLFFFFAIMFTFVAEVSISQIHIPFSV